MKSTLILHSRWININWFIHLFGWRRQSRTWVCVCVCAQRELLLPIMHHLRKHDPQCLKLSILNARWWYSNYITTTTTWKIWRKDLTSEVKHTHKHQPEIRVCFVCDDVQLAGVLSVMERKKKKTQSVWGLECVWASLSESRWAQIENRGNSVVCACRVINNTSAPGGQSSQTRRKIFLPLLWVNLPYVRIAAKKTDQGLVSSKSSRFIDVKKSQEDRYHSHSSCSRRALSHEAF